MKNLLLPIRLELRPAQLSLVPQLKELFPEIEAVAQETIRSYAYFATINLSAPGLTQAAFLQQHQIHYIDLQREREEVIKVCFQGLDINGVRIHSVTCCTDSLGHVSAYLEGKERDGQMWQTAHPYLHGEERDEHIFIVNFPASWQLRERGR
ncbi:hypothetical protein EPA93_35625 [Ktedonosporobacter rubrisoli]|uniref:Uncharacterized protein n=1 Tax=Ktedonosporobacter rubrisoli TaxID=2509675 RepID=A0A4P6JZH2_KTERU|nr:hypothetical protein [Ktedonosporobacter rubrisoli]QBD81015.1 hypothetical protein EPA93_35625 [Ktedonosporobacter rubrisoli]